MGELACSSYNLTIKFAMGVKIKATGKFKLNNNIGVCACVWGEERFKLMNLE